MPVDKFRRMSNAKTRDTGVSLTYINNNYIRSDGGNSVSGSIDMRGNTLYNVVNKGWVISLLILLMSFLPTSLPS